MGPKVRSKLQISPSRTSFRVIVPWGNRKCWNTNYPWSSASRIYRGVSCPPREQVDFKEKPFENTSASARRRWSDSLRWSSAIRRVPALRHAISHYPPKRKLDNKIDRKTFPRGWTSRLRNKPLPCKLVHQILDTSSTRRNSPMGKWMQRMYETKSKSRSTNHGTTAPCPTAIATSSICSSFSWLWWPFYYRPGSGKAKRETLVVSIHLPNMSRSTFGDVVWFRHWQFS